MTNDELRAKVDWEGGVQEAIQYGIMAEDIDDPKVAELWKLAESAQAMFESITNQIIDIIDARLGE